MKKKDKLITISEKKASILSLVLSAVFGMVCSFLVSIVLMEYVVQDKVVPLLNLVMLIFPILFIVFGVFSLVLLVIFNFNCKKK